MCLMITKPAGVKIKKAYLEEAFRRNGDGGGIAVAMGEKVLLVKPLWEFNDAWKVYEKFEAHPLLIHFRIKTHGSKCVDNTHPHRLTNKLVMAHNGIIVKAKTEGDESDTRAYIRERIRPILNEHGPWAVVSEENLKVYDGEIGESKLAFMNSLGHFSYANKKAGHDHEGCWWSNYSYRPAVVNRTTTDYDTSYNNNYYYSWRPSNADLEMQYCIGCCAGHQRRNTNGWFLNQQDLKESGVDGYKSTGITIYLCHECCDEHKVDRGNSGGWVTAIHKVPKSLHRRLQDYIQLLVEQDTFAEKPIGTSGYSTFNSKSCSCCGLKLDQHCFQPVYDPEVTDRKIVRNICRLCVGEVGLKTYYPKITETIGKSHKLWKYLVSCEKQAEKAYNDVHKIVVDDTVFPDWIERTKNLLTPEPEPEKPKPIDPTTSTVPATETETKPTSVGHVLHRGWACTMCGEFRLTILHGASDRLCLECNEAYSDSGFVWEDAAAIVAAKKNILPSGGKLILPPIKGKEEALA